MYPLPPNLQNCCQYEIKGLFASFMSKWKAYSHAVAEILM